MIQTWVRRLIIRSIILSWWVASTENTTNIGGGLRTVSSCICIGYGAAYLCTTNGNGATRWGGTAFDCPNSGNQFSLIHERYSHPNGTTKSCNEGAIIGWSVQVCESGYLSMLRVNMTLELNDTTVMCEYVDLSSHQEEFIGEKHIILTAAPFPPPDDTRLVAITPYSLKYRWSAVANACASLLYGINTDCGICINVTNITVVSCSINIHDLPKVCSFRVRSIVCGNIAGMWSNPVIVTLKVPEPVIIVSVRAHYASNGNLVALMIEFRGSDRDVFNISRGVDGSIQNYSIVYADAVTMLACDSVVSTNLTSFAPTSCFSSNNNISVSLLATNSLGEGPKTNITIASEVDYYVEVFISSEKITCQFLDEQNLFSTRLCSISYGECHDKEKWRTRWNYTTIESPFTVTLKTDLQDRDCYEVSGTVDNFTIIYLTGMYSNSASGELPVNLVAIYASIGTSIVVSALVLVVIIISIILTHAVCWLCKRHTINAHVVFELMDCPGEFEKVLIILQQKSINIIKTKIGRRDEKKSTRKMYLQFEKDLTDIDDINIRRQLKEVVPPNSEIEIYKSTEAFPDDNVGEECNDIDETCYVRRVLPSKSGALLSLLKSLQNGTYRENNIIGIAEIPITVCNKPFGHIIKIHFAM